MICAISGEVPTEPVVSVKSGHVFEKRLIKKWLDTKATCPITNEPLTLEDVIPLKVNHTVKPRPTTATSVPGLLQILQNEWDALMLETYSLKEQLASVKQELSHTLYQHDAACRVIARLMKERDEARNFAATNGQARVPSKQAKEMEAMEVEEQPLSAGLPEELKAIVAKKSEELSAARKTRVIPEDLTKAETIKSFKQLSSNTIHSPSQPGITTLETHPSDNSRIITGGIDGNALVFNIEARKIMATLSGHTGPITQALFHPSADTIVTTSKDKTARLWIPGEKGFVTNHVIKTHSGSVVGGSIHPSGKFFATASEDSSWAFHLFENGNTITKVNTGSPCSAISFHPDGLIFATGGGSDNSIKIWDVRSYKNVANFVGHKGMVSSLSFSENGYYLASCAQNTVKLWDLRKIKEFQSLEIAEGELSSVSFDYSGTYLAVAGPDVRVYLGKTLNHIVTYSKHNKPVTGAKFGPLAQYLVSVSMDRTVKVWGNK